MLLVLLNMTHCFFISVGMGSLLAPFISLKKPSIFRILIIGLFAEMIFIHFYALLFAVDFWFYLVNIFLAIVGGFLYRKKIIPEFFAIIACFFSWTRFVRFIAVALFFLVLMQSASLPYIPDNESYYIQSIKWLNEFGLVKGLANLHLFFGQMSGWHLLQSGFNFGFTSNRLNDLNGFLMLGCSFYFVHHLDKYLKGRKTQHLFLGLVPMGNLFFFQFVNTPSPDLPLFLLSQVIFYLFYLNYKNHEGDFRFIFLLSIFLIVIKITIAPILILSLILVVRHRLLRKQTGFIVSIGFVSLLAFACKNYMISGYLLYPLSSFGNFLNPDWKLPENLLNFYYHYTKMSAFTQIEQGDTANYSTFQLFKLWLFEPKLRLFFNFSVVGLLLIFPFFIKKNRAIFWLYIYALIQFFILFSTSPQYRFFIPLVVGMGMYIFAVLIKNQPKIVKLFVPILCFLPLIPLFHTIDIKGLTNNNFMPTQLESLHWKNILIPTKNSRFNYQYEKIKTGNLDYYSPTDTTSFFWISGDGPLPCVNQKMINYFEKYYHTRPQLRTQSLGDGFYTQTIEP